MLINVIEWEKNMRSEIYKKINDSQKTGKLHLVNMKINDDEIPEIVAEIKRLLPHVLVIDLDSNLLGDQGAHLLGEALLDFPSLKELSLQFNNIGPEGATAIFGLKNDLEDLDILFHGNKIDSVNEMLEIEKAAKRIGRSM